MDDGIDLHFTCWRRREYPSTWHQPHCVERPTLSACTGSCVPHHLPHSARYSVKCRLMAQPLVLPHVLRVTTVVPSPSKCRTGYKSRGSWVPSQNVSGVGNLIKTENFSGEASYLETFRRTVALEAFYSRRIQTCLLRNHFRRIQQFPSSGCVRPNCSPHGRAVH